MGKRLQTLIGISIIAVGAILMTTTIEGIVIQVVLLRLAGCARYLLFTAQSGLWQSS